MNNMNNLVLEKNIFSLDEAMVNNSTVSPVRPGLKWVRGQGSHSPK